MRDVGRASAHAIVATLLVAACSRGDGSPAARIADVGTADVHHFVDAWRQLSPTDPSCAPLSAYFRQATRGLRAYRDKMSMSQADLCAAVRRHPDGYASLESKLPALDSVATTIRTLFAKYLSFDSSAKAPGVYFVVGAGRSSGTTTRGRDPMILIGMELNHSVDGLAWTVAHEMAHTQQHYPFFGAMNGGPTFLRGSLLRHSIMEGSDDIVAELLTGQPKRNSYGEAHEAALWQEFQHDAQSRSYDRWLYNGWDVSGRGDRPADLGYWIGYRVAKSYYDRATDKSRALREILSIRDFDRFLAASGYDGRAAASGAR